MMLWILLALLALTALLPLGYALLKPGAARGRREADMALYRAQLAELDRDREVGRLNEAEHRAATLEVQRRLIAAADRTEAAPTTGRGAVMLLALPGLLAVAGLGLYLLRGTPGMPSAPYTLRAEAQARDDQIMALMRARVAALDQGTEQARRGWILLGNAERGRGRADAAIEAWERAATIRLDANIAGDIAELELERGNAAAAEPWITRGLAAEAADPRLRFLAGLIDAEGGRAAEARAKWQALLTDTPADAPWRAMLERRLSDLP
ncbi:c-type cytochrome biogenesis protein CcmI [Roseomonas sp. HJA6]|uniref:C-type cytochrome biogenesis protein CcmI n=1 Tax=Roseomonas alba TaxID=2846776 RepID=A0ABS7ACX7_9PROT|nr:c-type cytochrome biogenesis protein CcmI [Neoroseomonas alba]MBW6400143.1 c-type cytochrome biogenesis protein CcmI [Neoroseomonas alba]